MISGYGYSSAKIMFIADGATEHDVSTGRALSSHQDEMLIDGSCRANKINPKEVYKTALIKERINLSAPKKNLQLLNDNYKAILRQEIDAINPNVLVPLSELSFNFLTNLEGIRKFRGSILPTVANSRIARCVPILGNYPYINEDPKLIFISRLDFTKIAKVQNDVGPIPEEGNVWIAKNATQLREYFQRQYSKSQFVVLDIETFCGIPTCISFCFDGKESVTAPILDKDIALDDRVLMATEIGKLLYSELPKGNQNIKFDWKKLDRWALKVNNVQHDTMIAASVLYPEFPKNLGFLTSIYTDMPYFKDEGKEYDPAKHNRDRLYLYCAKDSLATHKIMEAQLLEMEETGTRKVYDMLMGILPIYKRMEEIGIRVDETQRENLYTKYNTLYDIQLIKLCRLTNKRQNELVGKGGTLSPQKMRRLVFDELGYKKIRGVKTTTTGEPSTDEESLELLMWMGFSNQFDAKEILKTIIALRKLHKIIEYLETPIHPDGRLRCEFNLAGAKTGRTTAGETTDSALIFSDGKVKHVNLGRSFQTIAKHGFELDGETLGKELRSLFVPSPGYAFVEGDLSQAEARVDAVLAKDFDILSVFDGPVGIHRLTGSWVFDCKPEEIKKSILVEGVDRYYMAKTVRHAGERNMREDRLMMMIHKPIQFCANVLKKFHQNQPNIREVFHKEIRDALKNTRCLVAPNGRKRDFFGRFDEHMINEGISQLPQAIVTDYLKSGLRKTFDACPYARPLVEAHDGFLSEVPIGKEEEYGHTFRTNTMVPINFTTCTLARDFELTIPCEIETSKENWKAMKEMKL